TTKVAQLLDVDAFAFSQILGLLSIIEVGILVLVALQLRRLEKAFERGEHANLEARTELSFGPQLAHLLLDQGEHEALPVTLDLDRLVMGVEPAAAPLSAVAV